MKNIIIDFYKSVRDQLFHLLKGIWEERANLNSYKNPETGEDVYYDCNGPISKELTIIFSLIGGANDIFFEGLRRQFGDGRVNFWGDIANRLIDSIRDALGFVEYVPDISKPSG